MLDPDNVGIAVGISFISYLEVEIHTFEVKRPPSCIFHFVYLDFMENYTISGFAAAILEYGMVMDMLGLCNFMAQIYLERVTNGFLSKKIGLGANFTPPPVKL